jgi:hypothetical protein
MNPYTTEISNLVSSCAFIARTYGQAPSKKLAQQFIRNFAEILHFTALGILKTADLDSARHIAGEFAQPEMLLHQRMRVEDLPRKHRKRATQLVDQLAELREALIAQLDDADVWRLMQWIKDHMPKYIDLVNEGDVETFIHDMMRDFVGRMASIEHAEPPKGPRN